MNDKQYIEKIFKAVSEGYPYKVIHHSYGDVEYWVRMDNPDYQPDDGSDPYLAVGLIVGGVA